MFSWNNTKSTIGRLRYSSQQWIPVSFHWHCWLKHSSACIAWVINFVLFLWNKRVYKVKTAICKWALKSLTLSIVWLFHYWTITNSRHTNTWHRVWARSISGQPSCHDMSCPAMPCHVMSCHVANMVSRIRSLRLSLRVLVLIVKTVFQSGKSFKVHKFFKV